MKKKLITFTLLLSIGFSQVSVDDLKNINNQKLNSLKDSFRDQDNLNESFTEPEINEINLNGTQKDKDLEYFGYNFLKKDISFFDNIPTPADFKLGPGDEITLSLWGATNSRETFNINKSGQIYYKNIGFINLSNLTLKEAEDKLSKELSKIYSTLNDGSSQLMIELGKIKSINVFFTGQVLEPGIHLIHPFSDVYSSLIQAGGIKKEGSLRNVKIIRDQKLVAIIDFYDFFNLGKDNFSNIRILDGDIIHVPIVANRVKVQGQVVEPKFYELIDTDSLLDVINYAGGIKARASNKAIIRDIVPIKNRISDDNAKLGRLVDLSEASSTYLSDGAEIELLPIAENDIDVFVYGKVVRPGAYPVLDTVLDKNNQIISKIFTLKDVLNMAGGFDNPVFRKMINNEIVVLRLDEKNFYSKELIVNYKDSNSFKLEVNDRIFVYENSNYDNALTYKMEGEVVKPGTYALKKGLTLGEAINLAEGITEIGSLNSVNVLKTIAYIDEGENEVQETKLVGNIDLDFEIKNGDIISILPESNIVTVEGNVYNPGFISHSGKRMTMSDAIELAGGYRPNSVKKNAYVIRANGEIEKANLFRGRAKRVFPGDKIFVPVDPNPDTFDFTAFIADLSSTLANIAAILVIADSNN